MKTAGQGGLRGELPPHQGGMGEGCWFCTELDGCEKGYYGNQDEYVAKATAMFIRKHGKETYTEALRRAVEAGENYPKSFDAQGSVEAALRLLEQYR